MPTQLMFGPNTLYSEDEVDAFGRARISSPVSVGYGFFQYGINPLDFVAHLVGGGTVVKTPNESSANLQVTAASGDVALLQSKRYFRYQPGKSQLVYMTGVIGGPVPTAISEIGYNDDRDGVFFRQSNGMQVVIRSSTSGSPEDIVFNQAQWNIDKMDGSGPSAILLDFTKMQLFVIDLEWLGTGRIRFGFNLQGRMYFCHEQLEANALTSPWCNSASLPCRWRLESTGISISGSSVKASCCSASSEGGLEVVPGLSFSADSGAVSKAVNARRPVLSIQMAPSFNGITNRAQVLMNNLEVVAGQGSVRWELVLNGTLTGAAFTPADTNSLINKDTAATSIVGGTVLMSGYCVGDNGGSSGNAPRGYIERELSKLLALSNSFDGTVGDIVTLVATSLSGTTQVNAAINWDEVR